MADGANDDKTPAPGLSDPEQTLLALIRDGRMDAEIAVRLGLPTGEVKARIERLQAKLAVESRAELRDWQPGRAHEGATAAPAERRPLARRGHPLAIAGGIAVLCVVLLGGWIVTRGASGTAVPARPPTLSADSGTLEGSRATAAAQLAAVTPVPVAPSPPGAQVDGRQVYDVGRMFVVGNHAYDAVASVDARETLTVVTLAGAGVVQMDGGAGITWSNSASDYQASLRARVGGVDLTLSIWASDQHTHLVPGSRDSVAFYNDNGGAPVLMLQAATTLDSATLWHVDVSPSGELFIATTPTPPTALLDEFTGELLSFNNPALGFVPFAAALGTADIAFTACDYEAPPSPCHAVWRATSPLKAPTDGWATCDTAGIGRFSPTGSTEEVVFTPNSSDQGCGKPLERTHVNAGDEMFDGGWFTITAHDGPDALSVGVASGLLWVGHFVGTVGCPCLRGS